MKTESNKLIVMIVSMLLVISTLHYSLANAEMSAPQKNC